MTVASPAQPATTSARVCRLGDLAPGLGRTFDVGGVRVAVFRTRQGMIYATDAACPHAGAPLADGIVANQCVVCPYHARRFDLATGGCDDAGSPAIRTYHAMVIGGWVVLDIPPA